MSLISILESIVFVIILSIVPVSIIYANFDIFKNAGIKNLSRIGFYIYIVFSGIAFIFVFGMFVISNLPSPSSDYISTHYKDLQNSDISRITERSLDNNDTEPKLCCLENETAIRNVLKDEELVARMLRAVTDSNMPCIASYHFKREGSNECMPHFIILNRRFVTLSTIGTMMKWFMQFGGSIMTRLLIDQYGKILHKDLGDYYFLFNTQYLGGSVKRDIRVKRHTSLCRWSDRETREMGFSIQIEAIEAIFYNGGIYIEPSTLLFRDQLAYCIQGFLSDIAKEQICK